MTNLLAILINVALLIINLILLASVITRKHKIRADYLYILMGVLLVSWQILEIVGFAIQDPYWITYLFTAKFAVIVFIPVLFLFIVANFYNVQKKIPLWMKISMVAIASLFAVMVLIGDFQDYFRTSVEIISLSPLTLVVPTNNYAYIAMMVFMQIPMIGVGIIVVTRRRKLPAAYRAEITVLFWSLIIYVVSVAVYSLGIFDDTGLDFSLFGTCLMNILFYVAVAGNLRSDYLNIWRGDVFDYLDEAILIVNNKGMIVDANQPAEKLFGNLKLFAVDVPVDQLWADIAVSADASLRELEGEDHETVSSDLYVADGEYPLVYEIQHSEFRDTAQGGRGEFIIFNEVTRNRLYIERLQDLAGVDSLTGLLNRFSYEQTIYEWDRPENLPLSIIMGDVNGLKTLNDDYGHQAGDDLLKKTAEILMKSCPSDAVVARLGGDEFAVLLKRSSEEDAEKVVNNILNTVSKTVDFPYAISIALGSATKNHSSENLNALCNQADVNMYINKKVAEATR